MSNDTLHVQEAIESSDDEGHDRKRRRRDEGSGFGGTLLGSGAPLPKTCPKCTLLNLASSSACSACDTPFS
jgi:hypothetical protein